MASELIKSKIKDLGKVVSGATPRTSNAEYWDGDIIWITPNDLSKNKTQYFDTSERKITEAGLSSCSAQLLPGKSLVFSSRAPIGYLALGIEKFATNQGCKSIIFSENSDPLFFYYNFQQYVPKLKYLGEGTTFSEISKSFLEEFEVEHPKDKKVQTRIAEILSTADAAIDQTEKLIAKYQRIKTGLMQDLLTKGIDEHGNIRSKTTHKFVVKNGIEVPEGWEVVPLKNACSIIKDGTHLPPKRVEDGPWLLGVSNIIDNEFRLTTSDTRISIDFYSQMHKNWKIEVGDILLAIVGATIGKVTQVPKNFPTFTLQRSVCLLRGKEKELSNDFLRFYFESKYFQIMLWNEVNVTAQPGLYLDTIGKLLIRRPSFKEQIEIVNKIISIKNVIDSGKQELNKLHQIKTGLMQDLLIGRVRVNFDKN